ncbi:MAG: hypothetical protein HBSAPP04_17150 [Ignavibacteriaceae bacterium]|nr:MAG: ATP-binding protein [Chlorobiota bacterium]GJQ32876.1 MAG: hypothetical protein HBSAPP04_17150 [Ignavibacteriaceae bacterium]
MKISRNISIRNRIEETVAVNNLVEETALEAGFLQKDVYDILIALDEILSNIVYYAYPNGKEGIIDIRIEMEGDDLTVSFIDEGIAFDPLAKADPDLAVPVEDREIGGLGIFIVKKLMNRVVYTREAGKNILVISKTKHGVNNGN